MLAALLGAVVPAASQAESAIDRGEYLVAAGGCILRFAGRLLFGGHETAATHVEIETVKGERVWRLARLRGDNYGLTLPVGDYRARLCLPNHEPLVRDFSIGRSGSTTVRFVVDD